MSLVPEGPDRYELFPELPARRGLATVNVGWPDKEMFDAIQLWLAHVRGRNVTHWDAFSFILAAALANKDSPLHDAELFPRLGEN